MDRKYLTCAETAQLVRAALREAFPEVRFSVRSKVYAGGASINITYQGFDGFEPLRSCYCAAGPTVREYDPNRCATCGYIGRLEPRYRPGMPRREAVEAVAHTFEGSGFDGMTDLKYPVTRYLDAHGRVVGSQSPGSWGSISAWDDPLPAGAVPVRFGADYIFVEAGR